MVSPLLWVSATLFVTLWIILWISTFGLHLQLNHEQGYPSQQFLGTKALAPSAALQSRVTDLEQHVHAAETTLNHLLAAANEKQHAAALRANAFVPPPLPPRPIVSELPAASALPKSHNHRIPEEKYSPSFNGHVILALNESAFRHTPIDVLMAQYGTADGGGSCDRDFGMGLIERWRGAARRCCAARSASSSSFKCHHVQQTRHHGSGDQLCVGHNVRVDLAQFADSSVTDSVMAKYISSKHMDQAYIHYKRSTLAATCGACQPPHPRVSVR
jgi:hypothetical protein